jgi:hypothetical protein
MCKLSLLFIQKRENVFKNFCVLVQSPSNASGTFPFKLSSSLIVLVMSLVVSVVAAMVSSLVARIHKGGGFTPIG